MNAPTRTKPHRAARQDDREILDPLVAELVRALARAAVRAEYRANQPNRGDE
jgi:hypothetical protein